MYGPILNESLEPRIDGGNQIAHQIIEDVNPAMGALEELECELIDRDSEFTENDYNKFYQMIHDAKRRTQEV